MQRRRGHVSAFAIAFALATWCASVPGNVEWAAAASCNGASHAAPTLSSGRASPGSGSPTTTIAFSVRYVDSIGCAPSSVEVVVAGVGRYRMSGSGTAYASGVTFRVSRRLPAGRWSYRFLATSGSGAGQRTTTLTSVSPTRVVITKPTPATKPQSAPKPTPRPTAKPQSGSKPSKRPSATSRPAAVSSPTPGASASPDGQAVVASGDPGSGGGHGSSGSGAGAPDGRPGSGAGGSGPDLSNADLGLGFAVDPVVGLPVAAWAVTTAFGVLVFGLGLLPVRGRRDPNQGRRRWFGLRSRALAIEGTTDASDAGWPAAPIAVAPRTSLRDGQTEGGSGGTDPRTAVVREPLRFSAPPRSGVDRRTIAYRFVRVADQPDLTTSTEVCRLDRGDEIEIIGEHEGFLQIRTPTGIEGWVQRIVIVG